MDAGERRSPPARGAGRRTLSSGDEFALRVERGEGPLVEASAGAPFAIVAVGVHTPDKPAETAKAKVPRLRCGNSSLSSWNEFFVPTAGKWELDTVRFPGPRAGGFLGPLGLCGGAGALVLGAGAGALVLGAGLGLTGEAGFVLPEVEPLEVEPEPLAPAFTRPNWSSRFLLACSRA